eukprot:5528085-Pyramimonas_sp.AAC.2
MFKWHGWMQWMQDDVTIQPLVEDINIMFESDLDVSSHQLYVDSLRTAAPMLMKDLAPLVFIDRHARRLADHPPTMHLLTRVRPCTPR